MGRRDTWECSKNRLGYCKELSITISLLLKLRCRGPQHSSSILSLWSAVVLKDHGMVPFIKIFLDNEWYRGASLSILEQLSVINAEEYMSIIVGALCSSTQEELQLKLDLLKVMSSLWWAFPWTCGGWLALAHGFIHSVGHRITQVRQYQLQRQINPYILSSLAH